jgi:predicted regulator of Ras-like GTPase activity (Roadblock/LC7/MglB family)
MQAGFVRVPKISTGADSTPASTTTSTDGLSTASSSSSSSDEEGPAAAAAAAASGEVSEAELSQLQALEIRVGRIISCEQHPDADR